VPCGWGVVCWGRGRGLSLVGFVVFLWGCGWLGGGGTGGGGA